MIACLGWGSLIWDLDGLPIDQLTGDVLAPAWARCAHEQGRAIGDWQTDGPPVRVEFLRRSGCRTCGPACGRGPLTLVLYEAATPVPSLWARMTNVDTLDAAVRSLATRERLTGGNAESNIGRWSRDQADPASIPGLSAWAAGHDDVDHVIWTALAPKFEGDAPPTEDGAVKYLDSLSGEHRRRAEEYVRCAPPQINTAYRRRIIDNLQWTPGPTPPR